MFKIFRSITLLIFIFSWCSADAQILRFNQNKSPLSVGFEQVNTGRVDLEFQINEISLNQIEINKKTYIKPDISGESRLQQKGQPDLPVICRSIQIPSKGEVSLRYQVMEYKEIQNSFVAPSKGNIPRSKNPFDIPYSFGTTYNLLKAWPKEAVTASKPFFIRNCRGITIRLCPFQYFPETKTLRVFLKIKIQVYLKNSSNENRSSSSMTMGSDPKTFQNIYANRFINYKKPAKSKRYTQLIRQGSMLIIAPDHLTDAVEPLAVWKNQMGIPTSIVPLSVIGSTAEDIKSYVQSAYDNKDLTYLLLVGDAEDTPPPIYDYSEEQGASDPSYAKLAGSDNYPDIFVGRLSGSTQNQIANMVEKSIQYEKSPDLSATWYNLATGIASDETGEIADTEHMDIVRTGLLANGYKSVDKIYDPGASAMQVANALNEGRGLINYVGHGDVHEWVTSGFTNNDVNSLTNTSAWPFIFDVACVNGQFVDDTCFAEAWLLAEHNGKPAGALAVYASTINQDWDPPLTSQKEFNRLLVLGDITRYGALCFNASMKMMDDWESSGPAMFSTWSVFGDPSVQVRTKPPATLSVSHKQVFSDASSNFSVQVNGIEGALVGLSSDGKYLGSGYTDSDGNAVIKIDPYPQSKTLQLTVTAFNAIPYITNIITSEAELSCSPVSFTKTINNGESLTQNLSISNIGTPSSTLEYSINILPDYSNNKNRAITSSGKLRNVSGSTITFSETEYTQGESLNLIMNLENNSPDDEWISEVQMTFPQTITINSATKLNENNSWDLIPDKTTGTGTTITWKAKDEENSIAKKATGNLNISISQSASGPLEIGWTIKGDSYGQEPHSISGVMTLNEAAPSLKLSSPNGGESWLIGSGQEITWSSYNYTDTVDIDFSSDGGSSWQSIEKGLKNSGSYLWNINIPDQSNNCLIRVAATDGSASIASDSSFSIYNSLNWITLSKNAGMITGNGTDDITLKFNASGKAEGTYNAVLEVTSIVGTSQIPVELTILPPNPELTIESKGSDDEKSCFISTILQ